VDTEHRHEASRADSSSFAGRVVVVSGVGPNLGATLVRDFAAAGAHVVLAARDAARLDGLAAELRAHGHHCTTVVADITVDADRARLVDAAVAAGGPHVLVNNAFSMGPMEKADALTPDDWRATFEVNVVGTVALTVAVAGAMAPRGGAVVMVGSQAARRGAARRGPYAASKAALLAAAQVLATELGPDGVRVNTVVPGQIWGDDLERYYTSIAERRGIALDDVVDEITRSIPLRRISRAAEVSAAVLFLSSDAASAITGQALDVNGGNWFH
jgi:NAD(P)-dependent dehydrogenase (short-subunit alcohol dehydrogenase family)